MRWLTLALLACLALVQADLWFGRSSLPHGMLLRQQLAAVQADNDAARARNLRISAEVSDLKEGLEMVEEKARGELGMVKPNEILVQLTAPH
ncbi:MAG: septum formation initiator family protein [Burkholderiales bacterium]|nr:septum formation initiator family protein [Burkholderiales bacterium]